MSDSRCRCRACWWAIAMLLLSAAIAGNTWAQDAPGAGAPEPEPEPHPLAHASGLELMQHVYDRHRQHPYVYEEQSMVLIDRNGNRETRQLRRYSRVDDDGSARFLLLFDSPREVQGVALLAERSADGQTRKQVYLPALGPRLIDSGGPDDNAMAGSPAEPADAARDEQFLGTDFSIENLTGETLGDYQYLRERDIEIDDVPYFVVDVYPADSAVGSGPPLRRHYIVQDVMYITRTDHFDNLGRPLKRHTHHDLRPVGGDMWRANMMLMSNSREQHQTLVKVDKRVFSPDYVPEKLFTPQWLFAQTPPGMLDTAAVQDSEPAVETVPPPASGEQP